MLLLPVWPLVTPRGVWRPQSCWSMLKIPAGVRLLIPRWLGGEGRLVTSHKGGSPGSPRRLIATVGGVLTVGGNEIPLPGSVFSDSTQGKRVPLHTAR